MDGTLVGLIIGVPLGMLIGPVIRSWLIWREVEAARREGAMADEILARLDGGDEPIEYERIDPINDV